MESGRKRTGRPREFCQDAALDAALGLFMKKGYEACSVDDLASTLGVNKPSLYAAFGNKEQLFVKVLRNYHSRYGQKFEELASRGLGPKETVKEWFSWFLDNFRSQDEPVGCLIVNSTLLAGENYPGIASELKSFHDLNEKLMADFLSSEKKAGRFSGDPHSTSQFLNAVVQGLAVLHRGQRNPAALRNIVRTALEAMPE